MYTVQGGRHRSLTVTQTGLEFQTVNTRRTSESSVHKNASQDSNTSALAVTTWRWDRQYTRWKTSMNAHISTRVQWDPKVWDQIENLDIYLFKTGNKQEVVEFWKILNQKTKQEMCNILNFYTQTVCFSLTWLYSIVTLVYFVYKLISFSCLFTELITIEYLSSCSCCFQISSCLKEAKVRGHG